MNVFQGVFVLKMANSFKNFGSGSHTLERVDFEAEGGSLYARFSREGGFLGATVLGGVPQR